MRQKMNIETDYRTLTKSEKCFWERLCIAHGIKVFVYSPNDRLTEMILAGDFAIEFQPDIQLIKSLRTNGERGKGLVLEVQNDFLLFGALCDSSGVLFVLGPALLKTPNFAQIHYIVKRYGISKNEVAFPIKSYLEIANALALAYIYHNNEPINENEIIMSAYPETIDKESMEKELFIQRYERSLKEKERYGENIEKEYFLAIEKGDIEFYNHLNVDVDALSKVGELAKSNIKQIEYMFVTTLVLARSAAVRGGMKYLEACDLSDLYLQKLERCSNAEQILGLLEIMRMDYVQRVHTQREQKNKVAYIEFCKDYITQKITKPFSVKELAKKIGVNPNYLSRRFSEEEGITLSEYRMHARIKAAANLLKYSKYKVGEISEYFCFSSASRFGSYFKRFYGITPTQYRNGYEVIEFMNESNSSNS